MNDTRIFLDLQIATETPLPFSEDLVKQWVQSALKQAKYHAPEAELTIRIVTVKEMTALNEAYRHKEGPTNVLSFPFENPPQISLPLLGDIIICADVIEKEAKEQHKSIISHWAHLITHGCLHLLGYDHIKKEQAEEMEQLEIIILQQLGFNNPYEV